MTTIIDIDHDRRRRRQRLFAMMVLAVSVTGAVFSEGAISTVSHFVNALIWLGLVLVITTDIREHEILDNDALHKEPRE